MDQLTLTRPDDWHIHLRDGNALKTTVPHVANQCRRAIVMPNLSPPITCTDAALAYKQRILEARPSGNPFEPLMTLYLTDSTSAAEIQRAKASGAIHGVKLYPAGATTNSALGVSKIEKTYAALAAMEEADLPLLVHGEVTRPEVDIFDREKRFIDEQLEPLMQRFPDLRVVFEHITTKEAAQFVVYAPKNIAATITPQHLLLNRNALLVGGIQPHHYCLPVLKREEHRQELLKVATSGNAKFFLGSDSAPHSQTAKESSCGCAGIYSAHATIELYAEAFESVAALGQLDAFAGRNGPKFYKLTPNSDTITLTRKKWRVADKFAFDDGVVIPLHAGHELSWCIETNNP